MTRIFVWTPNGELEFDGDTPGEAHKALRSTLRKAKVSIKKLRFDRETTWNNELHVMYWTREKIK